ncbi:MAG: alpha/beta fold hydrolase [Blastocatellia bacterium]|nr:alpha/beta fold hydrolase [Blastocatellia bacterium]
MKLNYQEYGQGRPIVILHGLFGSTDNWHTISKKLAESFKIYVLDLRNHGLSPHSSIFNYRVMAEDVAEFFSLHNLSSASIIGHSMGGKVAMTLANFYPERIEKLVVVDIAPKAYGRAHSDILEALISLDLSKYESRKQIDEELGLRVENQVVRQFLLKNLTRKEAGGFGWKMNLQGIYDSYAEINRAVEFDRSFEKPTLFISGSLSNYIKDEDSLLIKKLFPNSGLESIEGAGHWVHFEAPQAFLKLVEGFLRD